MVEKIFIFVLFLCPLIFFHELGHFFFARFFGVRVEVFSIGFGPKIFKYVKNGTQYAISIIPLGGYVKMFGDDPFSEVPLSDEEKKVAFNHKPKWARFWIVFGGPLANLLLAYFLYVGLLTAGEKVPETKIGMVAETLKLYEKGLRSGDVLTYINDEKILSIDDLNINDSQIQTITVKRRAEDVKMNVDMKFDDFLEEFKTVFMNGKKPLFIDGNGKHYLASISQGKFDKDQSLEELATMFAGNLYLYQVGATSDEIQLNTEKLVNSTEKNMLTALRSAGFYPMELSIRNVVMGSPADKAGIKKDDILLAYDGNELASFENLRTGLQKTADGKEISITVLSHGKTAVKNILPEVKTVEKQSVKIIGVESGVDYLQPKLVIAKADGFGTALVSAFHRTVDGVVKTFLGYKKLITREVSLDNIGGPLAIGKVASDSFNISLSMFFRLMAFISINLGVINLFPIPVLDGGHIVFLIIEAINRGPLSRRKLEFAQRVGVSMLFLLIFIALFNDVTRLFKS
ncbi:MAG: RIP metalloprotease RseP [Bdellovibrionota bacterium]